MKSDYNFLIFFAILNINGQIIKIGETTEGLISGAQNKVALIKSTLSKHVEIQNKFKSTLKTLNAGFPLVLADTYLNESIKNLEGLYEIKKGTFEEKCFSGVKRIKRDIKGQANLYFSSCVSRFQNLNKDEKKLLESLDQALDMFQGALDACVETETHKKMTSFKTLCVKNTETNFYRVTEDLMSTVEHRIEASYTIEDLAQCLTIASNRAADFLKTFKGYVRNCLTKSSDITADTLDSILHDPEDLQDSVFLEQSPESNSKVEELITKIGSKLVTVNAAVNRTYFSKNLMSNDSNRIFAYLFKDTKETILEEAVRFKDSERAEQCFKKFSLLLDNTLVRGEKEVKRCSSNDELKGNINKLQDIKTFFKDNYTEVRLECMSNVKNLFHFGGISSCIQENRSELFKELSNIEVNVYKLLHDSKAMLKRLDVCLNFALDESFRKQFEGKFALENCINQNTDNSNYSFPVFYKPTVY